MSIGISLGFPAVLADGTDLSTGSHTINLQQVGSKGTKYNFVATTADAALDIASLGGGILGPVLIENREALVIITTPSTPVIAPQGTVGSTAYSYKIVAKQSDGSFSAASAAGSTSTGNATLNGSNFNQITWNPVPGAASYDIYRTASAGTPSSTGLIGNTSATTFADTGLAGDSSTPPATGIDNVLLVGHTSGTYKTGRLKGQDPLYTRWNDTAIHVKSNTSPTVRGTITILED